VTRLTGSGHRQMRRVACFLLVLPLCGAAWAQETGHAYPTIDRVLFVHACARERPERPHTEMLYKCSCAIDAIARELDYADYVEASTAFHAGQIAGPRGTEVRESTTGKQGAERYRAVHGRAYEQCFIR